jgi:hypothetical protein
MTVSIKDVKKGTTVILRNGWKATVEDNTVNQHTRLCTVYGDYTEMGSVYSTDIVEAQMNDGSWQVVQHTPAQLKAAHLVMASGF